MKIPFNKPFLTGKEPLYLVQAVYSGKISGDGPFTRRCHEFFEKRYGFPRVFLTSSCTDALEMAALLLDVAPGDEVIAPSYTFVSTANAFVLRGAKMVFADCRSDCPNIDEDALVKLITPRTKAIVVVHYAGFPCRMETVLAAAQPRGICVVEDAAHAIDACYQGRPLGSFGQLATFSFHETKNVIAGEGGMLVVNDPKYAARAEIVWEKGTNRRAFFRGEVDKYSWVDLGSSFLPSDLVAAFLFAQLEELDRIQERRIAVWNRYYEALRPLEEAGLTRLPVVPLGHRANGHIFYLLCANSAERTALMQHLSKREILAVTHYLPLHQSPYYEGRHDGRDLPNAVRFADTLLRLPLYYEITDAEVDFVVKEVTAFFRGQRVSYLSGQA
jgi:dTDP-4-amino-4,6-dideoxygalactose transaminase